MSDDQRGMRGFLDGIARWRAAATDRVPSYHRLLHELAALLAEDSGEGAELARRLDGAWAARRFGVYYDRPLLLIASLRMDALAVGRAHPLWPALAAAEPDARSVSRAALLAAFAAESVWESLRTRFVQTNETSRALAWLWPAQIVGCGDGDNPLALVEAGTAAGLNLVSDRLARPWTTASGAPLPTAHAPALVARCGLDAHPLDACSDRDADWLRACVWAGEHERLARLEAAIAAFRAGPAQLERGDISAVPARLRALSAQHGERTVVLAFQTIVRDYLDAATRSAYEQGMRAWLRDAPPASALWVEIELDHTGSPQVVPITAHARDTAGEVDLVLGTTGYHPQTVRVDDAAVERLRRTFR